MDQEAFLELKFRPNVALISAVRRFISDCYQEVFNDAETTSRIALATHELLENGIRYSNHGETTLRLSVSEAAAPRVVTIRVSNQASAEQIERIRAVFREMDEHEDAFAHYQILMRRTMTRVDGSGLGLARVRCESEMKVSCEINGSEVVIVGVTHAGSRMPT